MTLREELLNGMRLNHPFLSTPKVSHILQTCWLAEPDARPSFSNIKELLLEDDKFPNSLVQKCQGFYQVPREKIAMHSTYKSIKKCDPLFMRNNNTEVRSQLPSVANSSEVSIYPESSIVFNLSRLGSRISTSSYKARMRGYLLPTNEGPKQNVVSREPLSSTTSANLKYNSVATTTTSYGENDYNAGEIKQLPPCKDDVFDK